MRMVKAMNKKNNVCLGLVDNFDGDKEDDVVIKKMMTMKKAKVSKNCASGLKHMTARIQMR